MDFGFSGRGGTWCRSCCGWRGEAGVKWFIVFTCAVVAATLLAAWFTITHSAKCIKYAERDEFLYLMWVGGVAVPVYTKPCLMYESEVQK